MAAPAPAPAPAPSGSNAMTATPAPAEESSGIFGGLLGMLGFGGKKSPENTAAPGAATGGRRRKSRKGSRKAHRKSRKGSRKAHRKSRKAQRKH
jgi:hypothetical protein